MVSELICLTILRLMRNATLKWTSPLPESEEKTEEYSASPSHIYRNLLGRYQLGEIDAAMRWLELSEYIAEVSGSIRGPIWYALTDKGLETAVKGTFDDKERKLLYQDQDPYAVFVAHQFNKDDTDIVAHIRDRVLLPYGFIMLDGRADGLEEFRTSILGKIRRARFFLCLLTKRVALASGAFASSVWLYQETGVAVAYGKRPLLLVEEGMDSDYVGELQSIYEHITFTRSNHPLKFEAISRRLIADLDANFMPHPRQNP